MNLLPAVLIGGPPNTGKSILFYSLTRALEKLILPSFYALRAAPDGEGHWTQEITPNQRQGLRFKGQWNSRWIDVTCRDLAARTMPTLVDVGGLPTAEQEVIFDQCNYAIVLTRAEDSPARKSWRHFPDQTLLLLNGPMPMWLFVSLGRVYRHLQGVVGEQATLGFGKTS